MPRRFAILFAVILLVGCNLSQTQETNKLANNISNSPTPPIIQLANATKHVTNQTIVLEKSSPTPKKIPSPTAIHYPLCSEEKAGEITTCIIPKSYCSFHPDVKGKPTFCNDEPYPANNFTFLVWNKDLSRYNGLCLIITGTVEIYKGLPEIIGDESSIEICD